MGGDTGLEVILYPKFVVTGIEVTLTEETIGVDKGWEVIL